MDEWDTSDQHSEGVEVTSRTSFNLQVFACFCFVLATCLRSIRGYPIYSAARWPRAGLAGILLLTGACYVFSLRDPLLSDDYILINASASASELLKHFTAPAGDGAMRPVGELVFGTFKLWAHADPTAWHSLSLALHLTNTLLLYLFCTRYLLAKRPALLACGLFGLHPSHPEAVAWAASTFDLLATLFSLLTFLAFTYKRSWLTLTASASFTALAILSKESAYCIPLVALLLFNGRRKDVYPSMLAALALFAHRWYVFGGPGGYLDATTGRAQIFNVTSLSALKALVYRPWLTLLVPIDWAAQPTFFFSVLIGLLYASLLFLAWTSRPPRRTHLLLIGAVMASLIPPIHLALIGGDLLGTRVFYLPSLLFCIWAAQIPRSWVVGGVLLLFSYVALRHNLRIRSSVALSGDRACRAAAQAVIEGNDIVAVQDLPRSIDGVFFFANGFEECVRATSQNAQARVILTIQLLRR